MNIARKRLLKAIEQLGKTEAERAKKLGFTVRAIDNWYAGKGLRTTERLIEAGVIHVTDTQCDQPADVAA